MFSTVRTSLIHKKYSLLVGKVLECACLIYSCYCSYVFSLCSQNNSLAEWCYKKSITYRTYDNYHPIPVPLNLVTIPTVALYNLGKRCRDTPNDKTKKTEETVCDHGKQRVIV